MAYAVGHGHARTVERVVTVGSLGGRAGVAAQHWGPLTHCKGNHTPSSQLQQLAGRGEAPRGGGGQVDGNKGLA